MIETSPFYHRGKILPVDTACSFLLRLELLFVLALYGGYNIAECHIAKQYHILFKYGKIKIGCLRGNG